MRSRLGRFAAAISIGLAAEILLFIGVVFIASKVSQPWGDRLAAVTQEPAYHLVNWLAKVHRPGFEEQAAYAMLIPLIQWMIWSVVFYVLLSRKKRSGSV